MAPPPRNTRGFPSQQRALEAWDEGSMTADSQAMLQSQIFDEPPQEVKNVIQQVQAYIFTRRIRVKDSFLDFDPLRSGRCTPQQFIRGLSNVVPFLKSDEMKRVADYYTDTRETVMKPQVICYLHFTRAVDCVFVVPDLEKFPTYKVPRPGSTLDGAVRDTPRPCEDEVAIQQVLQRLALLTKTRGVIFRAGFQDAERSLDTSLLCPRFAGKVTEMQFLQHFPFMQDVNAYELRLILQRYCTPSGDINYVAMDKDLQAIELEPSSPQSSLRFPLSARSGYASRPGTGPATVSVIGSKEPGSLRVQTPREQHYEDVDLLSRLKSEVAARRLRVHGSFQEMDRLRRGCVTTGQARTVFTILRIDLDHKELDMVQRMFNDGTGNFNYRDFCNVVNEVPLSARNGELPPTAPPRNEATPPPLRKFVERVRVQHTLLPEAEDLLAEAELWIAKRAERNMISVKACFQDYDRTRSGRVSRSQFLRIMDIHQLAMSADHLDVIMEAYGDATGREFSYLDLCQAVQRRAAEELNSTARCSWPRTPDPSKYFTRRGQVIPIGGGAPLSARPFTR